MMQLLPKKVIIITGSSSGIGRATALECAKHGARLVLHHIGNDQSKGDIESLMDEIAALNTNQEGVKAEAIEVPFDVTSPDCGPGLVEAAVSSFGEINGAVHNAGLCQFADFFGTDAAQRDLHMAVNYGGPFAITQAVAHQMCVQGRGGSLVSIASITALLGSASLAHYASTKAAILGLTMSGAVALGEHGIRFNAVSPGTVRTAMNAEDLKGPKGAAMASRVPLGRLGNPIDIAQPVVFFLSDMAGYVSGQNLIIDGGSSINYQ